MIAKTDLLCQGSIFFISDFILSVIGFLGILGIIGFLTTRRCCCKTEILNVANQQHPRHSRGAQVWAANGWEGSLPDTFRQTERKGSAEALSEMSARDPASEGGLAFTPSRVRARMRPL